MFLDTTSPDCWIQIARVIQGEILARVKEVGTCAVMLTGGRSAECLYKRWARLSEFHLLKNVDFYFTDERCVPPDSADSNYGMAMRTLFDRGVPSGCRVYRMEAEKNDLDFASFQYSQLLPLTIDVLLISAGDDGHIASLFPRSKSLTEFQRLIMPASNVTCQRLTITPRVIKEARKVFVLAIGPEKKRVYKLLKRNDLEITELPAKLVENAKWFLSEK